MILNWDSYFMGLSHLSALRSKDPHTQVGAAIVDDDHRVISVGYNGLPRGCADQEYPWQREGDVLDTKYPYVAHAELNAILNSKWSVKNTTIYVSLFPCNECAKAIIQSGIKRVVYESDKYAGTEMNVAAKRMLSSAGVELIKIPYQMKLNIELIENS